MFFLRETMPDLYWVATEHGRYCLSAFFSFFFLFLFLPAWSCFFKWFTSLSSVFISVFSFFLQRVAENKNKEFVKKPERERVRGSGKKEKKRTVFFSSSSFCRHPKHPFDSENKQQWRTIYVFIYIYGPTVGRVHFVRSNESFVFFPRFLNLCCLRQHR